MYAKTRVWEDFCENIAPQPYLDRRHAYDQFIETYGNVSCTTFPSLINLQILKNTFPSLRILDNDEFLLEIGMEKELKRTRKDGQYRNWTNIWISLEDKYDVLYIMDQTLTSYQLYSASTFQNLSNFYSIIKTDHERGRKYTSLIDLAQFQSHVSAYNFFVQPPDSVDCGVEYNILTTSTANHDSKYKDTNGLPLLIRFGSIFGSNRVLLSPTQQWIRAKVREAMILKKEGIIERVAVRIIDKIGGIGGYYGVHVRITEGLFYKDAITNIQEITSMSNQVCLIRIINTNFFRDIKGMHHISGNQTLWSIDKASFKFNCINPSYSTQDVYREHKIKHNYNSHNTYFHNIFGNGLSRFRPLQ